MVVEMQAQPVVRFREVAREVDAQRERVALDRGEGFLNQLVQILRKNARDDGRLQILNGRKVGLRSVAARLSEQGDVIPHRLISVGPAEVEHLHVAQLGVAPIDHIGAGRHHLYPGNVERPTVGIIDNNNARHGKIRCASR